MPGSIARDGFGDPQARGAPLPLRFDAAALTQRGHGPFSREYVVSQANRNVVLAALAGVLLSPGLCWAQVTRAADYTPPDDTPSIRVGVTLFADYTYNESPDITDGDGNVVHLSQFNVQRTYVNVMGNISHIVGFRITPDITRELTTGPSLSGSLVARIKYAFAQFNLGDWTTKGSWTRFGIQQTPWVDLEEGIYRYRFQGTVFAEREGYLSSSDAGASFHYTVPANYGDVHVGAYNGETYARAEANNRKAFQVRASGRPFAAGAPVLRGLRGHVFYDADSYITHDVRNRFIGSATYEHHHVNAGVNYLRTTDQATAMSPDLHGHGYSLWATPRLRRLEMLLRYDRMTPDRSHETQRHERKIAGVAYWFPHQADVSTALLVDWDSATFPNTATPRQTRIGVHGLVNF